MGREYFQPESLDEALNIRKKHENTSLLAGGTDIVVAMHKDKGPEGSIIDLSKIKELKEIEINGDEIKIGAMATFTAIADSQILRKNAEILCLAAETVGSPQIRNRGTIGGNICNASAAADVVTPLICLDAVVELQSMSTENTIQKRRIPLEYFIMGSKKISLEKDEVLTSVTFKVLSPGMLTSFKKIGRRNALAIARLNGACVLKIANKKVESINFALGAVTSKPERITAVENFLSGKELTEELLKDAGNLASDYVLNQTGNRPSSSYKLPVVARFTASLIESTVKGEEQTYE